MLPIIKDIIFKSIVVLAKMNKTNGKIIVSSANVTKKTIKPHKEEWICPGLDQHKNQIKRFS